MKYTPEKTHIYSQDGNYIATQPYRLSDFNTNPQQFFDAWDNSMIATDTWYDYPCLDGTRRGIREMTAEEKLTSGQVNLQDGQMLDPMTNKIVSIPIPNWLLKPRWNDTKNEWYEGSTYDELHEYIVQMSYKWRDERFDVGFDWTDRKGKSHHQRVRENDRARFLETKTVLDITKDIDPRQTIEWQFSDTDKAELNYDDVKQLIIFGGMLVQVGYRVNAAWRDIPKENIDLRIHTKENFFKAIDDGFTKVMQALMSKITPPKPASPAPETTEE